MLPGAISTAIVMPFAGKLVSHFPARNLVALGAIAFVVSSFLLSKLTMDTGYSQMFWPLVLRGAAMGFLFVPLTLATLIGLRARISPTAPGCSTWRGRSAEVRESPFCLRCSIGAWRSIARYWSSM